MKVLIVENEDAIAEPLAEGLRREGFEVERVGTGAEALAASEPDLVLLDLWLPDIDGFTVCRELRARSDVPIIVVTAKGEEVDRGVQAHSSPRAEASAEAPRAPRPRLLGVGSLGCVQPLGVLRVAVAGPRLEFGAGLRRG